MVLYWNKEAPRETDVADKFHQDRQFGVGKRFLGHLEDAASRITRNPYLYRKIEDDIRKCRLPHFSNALIYRIQPKSIPIIAVMHLRKAPDTGNTKI